MYRLDTPTPWTSTTAGAPGGGRGAAARGDVRQPLDHRPPAAGAVGAGDGRDPVEYGLGKVESTAAAVLVVSDFHMADGSAGGDDFLDSHLHRDEEVGVETGFFPPGESRAGLFAAVVTFALDRVRRAGG